MPLDNVVFFKILDELFTMFPGQECANLEKIREDMVKEGEEVSYQRWAEAAGVDEAELKSRLHAGYCCRERLIVTTDSPSGSSGTLQEHTPEWGRLSTIYFRLQHCIFSDPFL